MGKDSVNEKGLFSFSFLFNFFSSDEKMNFPSSVCLCAVTAFGEREKKIRN